MVARVLEWHNPNLRGMNVSENLLAAKPKIIGHIKDRDVYEATTKGGFSLVFTLKKTGETEMLGTGNHPAIARFVATKENPDCKLTELAKSESLPLWLIEKQAKEQRAFERTHEMKALEAALDEK